MKVSRYYWVDLVMAALAAILTLSSFLLWIVLPQGYFRSRLIWLDIHRWSGLALTLVVVLHLLLHRHWLWTMTRRHFGSGSVAAPHASDLPLRR